MAGTTVLDSGDSVRVGFPIRNLLKHQAEQDREHPYPPISHETARDPNSHETSPDFTSGVYTPAVQRAKRRAVLLDP